MQSYDVIVRCKNEIKWLESFDISLKDQSQQPNKIIFVDSGSTDGSLEFAYNHDYRVINYPKDKIFNYSHAINIGAIESRSQNILIISAHCILKDSSSIERLLEVMDIFNPAAVFGRQLPTVNSTAIDTRDLLTVFGRERVVYEKYPFFHNAFSLVKKSIWTKYPFDENVNGVEDRHWAQHVCSHGYKIIYEPTSCVYHEHGLHQAADEARAKRVCKSLAKLHEDDCFEFPEALR